MDVKTIDVDSWVRARLEICLAERTEKDFIDDEGIEYALRTHINHDPARIRDIVQKSKAIQTLAPHEVASLLQVEDPSLLEEMYAAAFEIKKKVYDNRIVTFAPLYLNNQCVNNCLYCGFRKDNCAITRKILSLEAVRREIETLAGAIGHKRLVAVFLSLIHI